MTDECILAKSGVWYFNLQCFLFVRLENAATDCCMLFHMSMNFEMFAMMFHQFKGYLLRSLFHEVTDSSGASAWQWLLSGSSWYSSGLLLTEALEPLSIGVFILFADIIKVEFLLQTNRRKPARLLGLLEKTFSLKKFHQKDSLLSKIREIQRSKLGLKRGPYPWWL